MSETYVTYRVWDGCKAPINLEYSGRLIGQIVRESTIDRDALLALADEMGRVRSRCDFCIKKGDCDWADETICLESRIDDYAQLIREALGAGR